MASSASADGRARCDERNLSSVPFVPLLTSPYHTVPTRLGVACFDLSSEGSYYHGVVLYSAQYESPHQPMSKNRHSLNHAMRKDSDHS